nr:MAG TPA: carbohydrate binding domain protein [Bacteriophage sp.]
MANYTPTFSKPYPSGWADKPSKTTPVTAAIMESYDTAIAALEAYLRDNAIDTVSVSVEQFPSDGREWLGTITVGSNQYRIYMPSLKYENSVSDGIKIGTITLGEQSFDVYAPSSSVGGSTVSVVPKTLTGTNIAEITVDGTTYQLYAPIGGGGSGSTVTAEATLTDGTEIGKITIDGVETILYAPTASAIIVDAELSATSENPVQNKVVKAEFDKVNSNLSNLKYGEIAGGKNLFKNYDVYNSYEVIAETYNGNSVIYSTSSWYGAYQKDLVLKKGKTYAISAYVKGSGNYYILCNRVNGDNVNIHGAEKLNDEWIKITTVYTPPFDVNKVRIENGTTGGLYISCFQIEEGTQATDYEPYIPSVKMLAEENAQQNDSISSLGKCKNLLKPTLQTTTQNGVTCTNNGDGTYTLNGTNSSSKNATFTAFLTVNYTGKIKMLGCPANDNVAMLQSQYDGSWADSKTWDKGNGCILENASKIGAISIVIYAGKTVNNLVFKPMFTTNLNATYDDFVPYTGEGDTLTADVAKINSDLSNIKDGTTPAAKAVADEDGNNIKSTYATKSELPSAPSSLYETVNVDIITDLFEKSITQNYVSCERVGNICTLSFWLQATANVDHKHRHELFDIDKIPKNNLTIGFCVVNFNGSVSNSANDAYNYINSISVEQYYNSILKRNISRVYLLPYHTDHVVMSSGNDFIGQISWVVEA